ncbi:DUF4355 domain-containing protein [Hungatella hathewayi]|uniref:DUF4355 domain-containing protein n=1 Tax=Hungatella hathewayi TaxID=154046 RepID=UPI0022E31F5B|nr:DUF4355 domain-containing protein [Hungatella hathewayi]
MRKTGFTGISPKMNLQFFAESGDGAGADQGEGSGSGSETAESGTDGAETGNKEPKSFDDLLQDKNYQAEFDRRVQKALGTAKEKWEALMDDKLSEADKLAKMNKEEKAEYLRQKQEKELKDREAAITRRELMAEAKNTLAEKKLPVGLAEVLNYTDAESCNKSMATVEKAFQEAVQAAVEEKLKGGEPLKKALSEDGKDLAKQVEDLMMGI